MMSCYFVVTLQRTQVKETPCQRLCDELFTFNARMVQVGGGGREMSRSRCVVGAFSVSSPFQICTVTTRH